MPHLSHSRFSALVLLLTVLGAVAISGCAQNLFFRGQSPDVDEVLGSESADLDEDSVTLIGDVAVPYGVDYLEVEAVALVTGLPSTGSDPPPSPQRNRLINEMQTYEVKDPNQVLASPSTSLVLVRGYIPPGAQEGDRFDIEVRVPTRSETSSLRGGWLMKSRLRELAVLGGAIHSGHVIALAAGPVVIESSFSDAEDKVLEVRGRVLGGGVALKSRPLGLAIRNSQASIVTASRIGNAINSRFHMFDASNTKTGVANPKSDSYVELKVHPLYKHNLGRYLRVIRSIAIAEGTTGRAARLVLLENMLLEPTTAARAALQLEAIGHQGVPILKKGLASNNPEVRFYSAEALAYLDEAAAAPVLAHAARHESAFRWHALTALSVMNHVAALDELTRLLDESSAETRYGAFRALSIRNARGHLVKGEVLNDELLLHVVPTNGESMVHVARARSPEVVIFGHETRLKSPQVLYAGNEVLIKSVGENQIRVSRFSPGKEDRQETCSARLSDVIRTSVNLGAGYAEILQMLEEAKSRGYLEARLVMDARPRANRRYRREESGEELVKEAATPLPEMFAPGVPDGPSSGGGIPEDIDPEGGESKRGLFGRMTGWFSGQ